MHCCSDMVGIASSREVALGISLDSLSLSRIQKAISRVSQTKQPAPPRARRPVSDRHGRGRARKRAADQGQPNTNGGALAASFIIFALFALASRATSTSRRWRHVSRHRRDAPRSRLSDEEIGDVAAYVIDQANGDKWDD